MVFLSACRCFLPCFVDALGRVYTKLGWGGVRLLVETVDCKTSHPHYLSDAETISRL